MSDMFHDAYRPANKPKGFGWWPHQEQDAYCQQIFVRGDRDEWLLLRMFRLGQIDLPRFRELMTENHPERVAEFEAAALARGEQVTEPGQ